MSVSPTMIYDLSTFLMTLGKLKELDRLQRRILRRIIGWRRIDGEEWRTTMIRMNGRLSRANQIYARKSWSSSFARSQWRYVCHLLHGPISLWSRILCKYNWSAAYDPQSCVIPHRRLGHPRRKWDNHIHSFCLFLWPAQEYTHWFDILVNRYAEDYEETYTEYLSHALV